MGMRTIRWRNGQCPGRNGQWAERIAHAGSEAVRLVPFSSLPAVILDYLRREYLVSAWRLPLCLEPVMDYSTDTRCGSAESMVNGINHPAITKVTWSRLEAQVGEIGPR